MYNHKATNYTEDALSLCTRNESEHVFTNLVQTKLGAVGTLSWHTHIGFNVYITT